MHAAAQKSLVDKIKEAGTHTIIYGLGSVLQSALGFVLIPLYTSYYTTDMYGALALINMCGSFAGAVFFLGASSALARSYYDYDDPAERKKVVSTSLYISLFGAMLQVLVGFFLADGISNWLFHDQNYSTHILLILISTAVTFLNNVFYMLLRFLRMSKQVVSVNILSLLLSVGLILLFLVGMNMEIMAPILGILISQTLIFVLLLVMTRKHLVLGYSAIELKVQLSYGLQSVFIGLAYYSFDWLNRFFLNKYCSLADVGIYSLGYQLGSVVNILFILPFCQIWAPMRMEYRAHEDAGELYKKILTYYFLASLLLTTFVATFAEDILSLLSGKIDYVVSYKIVPLVMLGLVLYGSINIIDNGIYFSRKIIYHAYIFWAVSIVAFVLNLLFVEDYGYMGAALIITFCYALIVALVYVVSNRLRKIEVEKARLALLFAFSSATVSIAWFIEMENYGFLLAAKAALIVAFMTVIYLFVLTASEKHKLARLLMRSPQ